MHQEIGAPQNTTPASTAPTTTTPAEPEVSKAATTKSDTAIMKKPASTTATPSTKMSTLGALFQKLPPMYLTQTQLAATYSEFVEIAKKNLSGERVNPESHIDLLCDELDALMEASVEATPDLIFIRTCMLNLATYAMATATSLRMGIDEIKLTQLREDSSKRIAKYSSETSKVSTEGSIIVQPSTKEEPLPPDVIIHHGNRYRIATPSLRVHGENVLVPGNGPNHMDVITVSQAITDGHLIPLIKGIVRNHEGSNSLVARVFIHNSQQYRLLEPQAKWNPSERMVEFYDSKDKTMHSYAVDLAKTMHLIIEHETKVGFRFEYRTKVYEVVDPNVTFDGALVHVKRGTASSVYMSVASAEGAKLIKEIR